MIPAEVQYYLDTVVVIAVIAAVVIVIDADEMLLPHHSRDHALMPSATV